MSPPDPAASVAGLLCHRRPPDEVAYTTGRPRGVGCRAVLPLMKARRYGRILSLSSMSWRGNFGQTNYAAAKAGVVGLARTLALEAAPYGITSNVLAPGLIDTPMLASMDPAARTKLAGRVPAGRIGRPAEIAEAAAFLCSADAGYVTGVVLDVDGGISIGSSLR